MQDLLVSIDARELAEWEILYRAEPWGETRGDWQTAMLAALLANQWRGKGTPAKPQDFIPDFWGEKKQPSVAKMLAVGQAFAAATRARSGGR